MAKVFGGTPNIFMFWLFSENGSISEQIVNMALTLYLPHFEGQYLVHLQILIKIAQETLSFHTYMV